MADKEQELMARGAEVVAGDMLLKRKQVGMYRNGQFILTPEGAEELDNVIEVEAVEVAPKSKAKPKTKIKIEMVQAEPTVTQVEDDLAGLDDALEG